MLTKIISRYHYATILLRQLVITDFKLRYQSSALGYLWSLLKPFSLFLIMYVVFVKVLGAGADIPNFGVYLLIGIVVWNYFAEVTNGSVTAVVGRGDMLRKLNFPKYVIVVAVSLSAMINLLFNIVVVAIFLIVSQTDINITAVFAPFLLIELFVFSLGVGLLLSALYVRFRDIGFIWEVIMQAAFFATPIMYAFSLVTDKSILAGKILLLNPVAQIMQDLRYMLVSSDKTTTIDKLFDTPYATLMPLAIVAIVFIFAVWYFRAHSKSFAEEA